jgi:hypothetical protein
LFQILACSAVCPLSLSIHGFSDLGQVIVAVLSVAVKIKHHIKHQRLLVRATEDEATRVEKGEVVHYIDEDAAFGIKALFKEPEVEGVWHSRGNSLHSNNGSERLRADSDLLERAETQASTGTRLDVSSGATLASQAGMVALMSYQRCTLT